MSYFLLQRTNLILLVTPLKTMTVSCTEVSTEFSSVPLDGENSKVIQDNKNFFNFESY